MSVINEDSEVVVSNRKQILKESSSSDGRRSGTQTPPQLLVDHGDKVFVFYYPDKAIIDFLENLTKKLTAKVRDMQLYRSLFYSYSYSVWMNKKDSKALQEVIDKITKEVEGAAPVVVPTPDIYARDFQFLKIHQYLFCTIERYMLVNTFDDESIPNIVNAVQAISSNSPLDIPEYYCLLHIYRMVVLDYRKPTSVLSNSK
jgi:hypothetical protein